ncbi:hypothetical protein H5P28_15420 [Ruficoccus amylovorans]|uniref:Uncharacterized protein n=1 Tax=Ruficoccus amylovorans TaxID=1804625 RepID=A0A842HJJ1_9BACT|nr:hypothetical protein [Ruficoccus amylovorans]MBC2595657.1 hypothetical protein [Ruficoccus amylovorans]
MKPETLRKYFGDMPPLEHYPLRDYREFRWEDSEVVEYISSHPQFMTNLFCQIRQSGAVVFDPVTKTWRGYRYHQQAKSGCCQNSPSKPDSFSSSPLSKPHPYISDIGMGGVCDSRQSPDPLVTAAVNSDSGEKTERQVGDEPW